MDPHGMSLQVLPLSKLDTNRTQPIVGCSELIICVIWTLCYRFMLARSSLLPVLLVFSTLFQLCTWVKTSITPIKTCSNPCAAHCVLFWTHHMCHVGTLLSFHARAQLFTACFTCVFIPFSVVYMTKNGYYPYQNVFQPVRSPSCGVLNSSYVSCGHIILSFHARA